MNDGSAMKTPGGMLAAARRARGLGLDELSARTKIPPPVLAALEADEYHRISGPLYIKSFLRTCAGELGLDADELLVLYSSFAGESGASPGDPVWEEEQVQISRIGFPWVRVALGVAVAAAVLVGAILLVGRGCAARSERPVTARPAPVPEREVAPTPLPTSTAADSAAAGAPANDAGASAPPPASAPPAAAPARRSAAAARGLAPALAGDPRLEFSGGRHWPVVLRLVSPAPVDVRLQRDGEGRFLRAVWPGGEPTALPAEGIEPGRAYAVREGLAVYWGASDHFSLSVDPAAGVEVTVNGARRDISTLHAGDTVILDLHATEGAGDR